MNINSVMKEITTNLYSMTIFYSNPIVIIQSVAFVLFFSTLNLKSKIINNLSKLTLGVYLIHDNNFIRENLYKWVGIDNGNFNNYSFILYIMAITVAIYISCSLLEWIRQKIFQFVYRRKISTRVREKYYNWLYNLRIKPQS